MGIENFEPGLKFSIGIEFFRSQGPLLSLEKDQGETRSGATGPRASERKPFLREGLREDLRKRPRGADFLFGVPQMSEPFAIGPVQFS